MTEEHDAPAIISWPRAIVASVLIAAVGILALVYVPNWILTKIHGKTRSSLVAVATTTFFILLVALAWTMRRLQRRKVI
jgi:hypothetical protein